MTQRMFFISAIKTSSVILLTLSFLTACSTPQQNKDKKVSASGFSTSDQKAQALKLRQEREQDRRDRKLMSQAKTQVLSVDPLPKPAFKQTTSLNSMTTATRVIPQQSRPLEVLPQKTFASSDSQDDSRSSHGAASDSMSIKMSEGQLFAEIHDRYEAHDLWGFQSRAKVYLGKFSGGDRRDEVMYMQGLMQLGERNYGVALIEFNKILRDHPNGRKAPSALFAKGVTFERMNLKREARQALAKVIGLFPGSPEAARASNEMKTIK